MILRDRLAALHPGASRRQLKRWLEGSRVRVNGAVVRRGDVPVRPGDRVELAAPPPPAFPAPLAPIHEDAAILVVDKPAGLLTIATARERERTAYRLLMDYLAGGRPSGRERVYVAVVEGRVRDTEGTLRARLDPAPRPRLRATREGPRGKEAITRYRVLERRAATTALELLLVTGRRGQIRAQLAAAGHPIVGDVVYGSRRNPLRRVCLHATRLAFVHPDGRRVSFESPPPAAFGRV